MATTMIPSGNTQFLIQDDDTIYVLGTNDTRTATGDTAIFAPFGHHNDKLIIKGHAEADAQFTVVLSGEDMVLQVASSGSILGNSGAELTGPDAQLLNFGQIKSTYDFGYGLLYGGEDTVVKNVGKILASNVSGSAIVASGGMNGEIVNGGTLQGAYGVNMSAAATTIELGAASVITSTKAGIYSTNSQPDQQVHVENHGKITALGTSFAIQLSDPADTVINQGHMVGRIAMGGGNDVFDNRGGTVDHAIEGGLGNDTLITDDASAKLKEAAGAGYDTVRSSVSYTLSTNVERLVLFGTVNAAGKGTAQGDDLYGNLGKNHLYGLAGADLLDGGRGNDLLTGGLGNDTFVFKTAYGHDTITDFDPGHDKIDVSQWTGIDNFADIKSHMTASGGDVFITLGSDQLVLQDTAKADVHAGDFIFV